MNLNEYFVVPRKDIYQVFEYLKSIVDVKEIRKEDRRSLFVICEFNSKMKLNKNSKDIPDIKDLSTLKKFNAKSKENTEIKVYEIIKNEKSYHYFKINNDNDLHISFDFFNSYMESNCSKLLYELRIYKGIDTNDIEDKNEYYFEYLDIIKTYIELWCN